MKESCVLLSLRIFQKMKYTIIVHNKKTGFLSSSILSLKNFMFIRRSLVKKQEVIHLSMCNFLFLHYGAFQNVVWPGLVVVGKNTGQGS